MRQLNLFGWVASAARPVHPLGLNHKWLVFWAGPTEQDQRECMERYIAETEWERKYVPHTGLPF
jgi:hypothetical protein